MADKKVELDLCAKTQDPNEKAKEKLDSKGAGGASAASSIGSAAASDSSDAPSILAASAPMSRSSAALAGRAFGVSAGEAFAASVATSTPNVSVFASSAGRYFAETIASLGAGAAFLEAAHDVFSRHHAETTKKLPIYASETYGFSSFEERQRILNIEKKALGLDFDRVRDSKTPIFVELTQMVTCLGIEGGTISVMGRVTQSPIWVDEQGSFEMEILFGVDTDNHKLWMPTETGATLAKNELVTFRCGYSNDVLRWENAYDCMIRPWLIWNATPKSVSVRAPYLKNGKDPVKLIFRLESLLKVL